jgi:hypothetical protein
VLLAADPIHPAQPLDYFGVLGPKYLGDNVLIGDYGVACMGAADREATRRSAADEVRHARLTATLARSYGDVVRAPHVTAPASSRGAFEIALENAAEGCVRETFGALIAWHQAAFARDPSVAAIMCGIAVDETRHAELSWTIAEWLEPQRSEGERRLLAAAREQAVQQLEREISADTLPALAREQISMPTQAIQRALTDRMAATLGLS